MYAVNAVLWQPGELTQNWTNKQTNQRKLSKNDALFNPILRILESAL